MKPIDIASELKANSYPGRGLILGRSEDGSRAVLIYFYHGQERQQQEPRFYGLPTTASARRPSTL